MLLQLQGLQFKGPIKTFGRRNEYCNGTHSVAALAALTVFNLAFKKSSISA